MGNKATDDLDELIPDKGAGFDLIVLGLQESTYSIKSTKSLKVQQAKPNPEAPNTSFNEDDEDEVEDDGVGEDNDQTSQAMFGRATSLAASIEPSYQHLLDSILHVIGETFVIVKKARRAQMQLLIFCRRELKHAISKVERSSENTGFLHLLPNKGGLCITLTIGQTTLAFISCHLAAHEGHHKCAQRNDSVEEILGGVRSGDRRFDPTLQYHHTIWMGDLNYRLTFDSRTPVTKQRTPSEYEPSLPLDDPSIVVEAPLTMTKVEQYDEILRLVKEERWAELLKLDELTREIAAGRVLDGFTALKPCFPPTFKRTKQVGMLRYSTTRRPSLPHEKALKATHKLSSFHIRSNTVVVQGMANKRRGSRERGGSKLDSVQENSVHEQGGEWGSSVKASVAVDVEQSSVDSHEESVSVRETGTGSGDKVEEIEESRGEVEVLADEDANASEETEASHHQELSDAGVSADAVEMEGTVQADDACVEELSGSRVDANEEAEEMKDGPVEDVVKDEELQHSLEAEEEEEDEEEIFVSIIAPSRDDAEPEPLPMSLNRDETPVLPRLSASDPVSAPVPMHRSDSLDSEDSDEDSVVVDIHRAKLLKEESRLSTASDSELRVYYSEKRLPSYTDRILYKSLPRFSSDEHIRPLYFESCEIASSSDHKPVRACFEIKLVDGLHGIMAPKPIMKKFMSSKRLSSASVQSSRTLKSLLLPRYLKFELCELSARGLTEMDDQIYGGLSDPYIRVTADPKQILLSPRDKIESKVVFHNCNPDWGDEVVTFNICTVHLEGLAANAHLFLSVWDHDKTKSHDLIGLMAIALRDILDSYSAGEAFTFDGPIFSNSLKQGELKGLIRITPMSDENTPVEPITPLKRMSLTELGLSTDFTLATVEEQTTASAVTCGCWGADTSCSVT